MSKIITAEEMAAHYAPLLDLHGALKEVERLSAENERLRALLNLVADQADHGIYPRPIIGDTE